MAGRLHMSAAVLYNKLRSQVTTHHTSFEESAVIQELLGEMMRPDAYDALQSYAWRLGHVAIQLPQVAGDENPAQIMQHLCHTFKEGGDVAQAIERALVDDERISAQEYEAIEKEIMDNVTALVRLRELCRLKFERDNPGE